MKPLFFFILIFVSVFTSFPSPAQFPKPWHDGYRMLDKEANRIIRNHGYKYDEPD